MIKTPTKIFAVPIEGPSWPELERSLQERPEGSSAFWIVTANPEILLEARRDPVYAEVLKQADIRTVDGMGLWLSTKIFGSSSTRLTGVELSEYLLEYAIAHQWKVALIGGEDPKRADQAARVLRERYPALRLVAEHGGLISREGEMSEEGEEASHRLTLEGPQLLLVAFGHPRQERWLARYLHQFPTVRIAVGIGGTIDFWAGTVRRAPAFWRRLGIEWLWRLFQEPKRLPRILRAVIVFPLSMILDLIKGSSSSQSHRP